MINNRSYLILLVAIFLSCGTVSAQNIDAPWLTRKKLEATPRTIHDKSHLRVFYQLFYRPDHNAKDVKKEVLTTLLVGDKALMYEDYNSLREDSLMSAYVKQGKTVGEFMEAAMPLKVKYKDKVIVLLDKSTIVYALNSVPFNNYYYEEAIPNFDWQLLDETKTISGLKCQKAKMSFRGRDYEAWYSTEVALPYGPYKFGGLPGLIVEIYDVDMDYQFTLVKIEQGDLGDEIGMNYENNRLIKTSRVNAMKALENYRNNPSKTMSQRVKTADGKPAKVKTLSHNPIELE